MKYSLLFILLLTFELFSAVLPKNAPFAGGVVVYEINSTVPPKVYHGKRQLMVLPAQHKEQYYVVAGIPLSQESQKPYTLSIYKGSKKSVEKVDLKAKSYKKQYITIKNKRKVSPHKMDMKRINSEKARSHKALALYTPQKFVDLAMIKPVDVKISDDFGKRRYFNKKPRRPHSGVDMPAPVGTAIVAPLGGEIAEMGAFFFNGNVIFIDHGLGLVSMYCHMSKFDVKKGDRVKKGQKIGEVGKTGRVTGPHLHWGVSLNGAMVDPRLFFVNQK